ncbi:MAG: hypothetical protein Q7T49_00990 [bacterium]|nr:hypothetical protein [bacterium]
MQLNRQFLLTVVVIFLIIVIGGYFFYQKNIKTNNWFWRTYISENHKYQFDYPPVSQLTFLNKNEITFSPEEFARGLTPEDILSKYGKDMCIYVTYGGSTLSIVSPDNIGSAHANCLRTGYGSNNRKRSTKNIIIDNKSYVLYIIEELDDNNNPISKTSTISFPNKFVAQINSLVNKNKYEGEQVLMSVLSSLKFIPY